MEDVDNDRFCNRPFRFSLGTEPRSQHSGAPRDWGCEVLLCLANPNGPTAVPPCLPPIQELWRALARGHAFPTCTMASGPNGRSHVRPAHSYYDHCPRGTSELPVGQVAELAATTVTPPALPAPSGVPSTYTGATAGRIYAGIGDGSAYGVPNSKRRTTPKKFVWRAMGERGASGAATRRSPCTSSTPSTCPPRMVLRDCWTSTSTTPIGKAFAGRGQRVQRTRRNSSGRRPMQHHLAAWCGSPATTRPLRFFNASSTSALHRRWHQRR